MANDPMFSDKNRYGSGGGMSASEYDPDGDKKVTPESHSHPISDVNSLQGELDSKANVGHTHSEYARSDHNHDGTYAPVNHTHSEYAKEVSEVTQTAGGAALADVEAKLNELIASLKA